MKKTRLVINLEPDEIVKAKKHAKAKGISVSKLVEDYLISMINSDRDFDYTTVDTNALKPNE
ncbi:hypothetical protein BDD43_5619 [Mucilaginibacter gracilis]|uniref:Ribbon-helix-helix CopG family protein n=1 Tax=Mucilaginibacter gracilis TaxID=423350 RepID=A0A495J8L9_9SPHI|nr:DUF6364 family protein [Mucilaginibacter gracilis]RKR85350.1 hypothetical protein BDD43_5619 [Mucilaginibacter gracilis]